MRARRIVNNKLVFRNFAIVFVIILHKTRAHSPVWCLWPKSDCSFFRNKISFNFDWFPKTAWMSIISIQNFNHFCFDRQMRLALIPEFVLLNYLFGRDARVRSARFGPSLRNCPFGHGLICRIYAEIFKFVCIKLAPRIVLLSGNAINKGHCREMRCLNVFVY